MARRGDDTAQRRDWRLAREVAAVTATLGATAAGALHHFWGVPHLTLVVAAAGVGLAVGSRVPTPGRAGAEHSGAAGSRHAPAA